MALQQTPLAGMDSFKRPTSAMDLLQIALTNNAAIDVIERLAAIQREERAHEALLDFNEALNRVQKAIKRIVPDLENPSKKSKYASFAAIDRVIRPVYSEEGFSLSFTHADCPKPNHIRVICRVALRSHVEPYQIDMPVDTKGPNGNAVMTETHATAGADSYAKRYLVKDIFNVAIGEDDDDGNLTMGWVANEIKAIENCKTLEGLQQAYRSAFNQAKAEKAAKALLVLTEAYDRKKATFA